MALGYELRAEDETYVPSRPARRADSRRGGGGRDNDGYGGSSYYESRTGGSLRRTTKQETTYTGGHYAESPIHMPTAERTLAIVPSSASPPPQPRPRGSRRSAAASTAAGSERRSRSAASRYPPTAAAGSHAGTQHTMTLPGEGTQTVSKVTRSRSLTSRPAGLNVFHRPGFAGVASAHEKIPAEAYAVQAQQSRPSSRAMTRMSSKSGKSHAAGSTTTGRNTTKAGVVVETMSAPNPFCPNTRGVCCLMVLVNLALILVAIGFIIVLQLHDPAFVWNLGVVILAFGFFTFFVALVYCVCICQESQHRRPGQPASGELYWTHHWQKNITMPELRSRDKDRWEEQERFPEDDERQQQQQRRDGDLSDTSSRDYPRLYLESDYGQRTDREADFETEQEGRGERDRGGGRYHDDHHSKGRL